MSPSFPVPLPWDSTRMCLSAPGLSPGSGTGPLVLGLAPGHKAWTFSCTPGPRCESEHRPFPGSPRCHTRTGQRCPPDTSGQGTDLPLGRWVVTVGKGMGNRWLPRLSPHPSRVPQGRDHAVGQATSLGQGPSRFPGLRSATGWGEPLHHCHRHGEGDRDKGHGLEPESFKNLSFISLSEASPSV